MNGDFGIVGISLITLNAIISYLGFRNPAVIEKYCFSVNSILHKKDFKRLITSGFFHVNWLHLIMNMISLYFFSGLLENEIGPLLFAVIYMISLIGGNVLALFIHRKNVNYKAVGASGAVSGIVFSSIALFPGMTLRIFPIPLDIPAWLFGMVYVFITMYGIRSKRTNIGHEAHLGGALAGMLLAIAMYPQKLIENYFPILVITLPTIVFIILIAVNPGILSFQFAKRKSIMATIDDDYNEARANREQEIDRILEKIHKHGMKSLTSKEKKQLESYSNKKI